MNNLIQKAILTAMKAHAGQIGKGDGKTPYILHPLEVAMVVPNYTSSEVLIASAILHDVVETGKIGIQEIKTHFGDEIANHVKCLTKDRSIDEWADRKVENLKRLSELKSAYFIKTADGMVNMRDLVTALQENGESVWDNFNATKPQMMQYYQAILDDMHGEMPSNLLVKYVSALKDLEYVNAAPAPIRLIGFGNSDEKN